MAGNGNEISVNAMKSNEKATQFGGERANAHSSNPLLNKPWSIRNAQRYFAAVNLEMKDIAGKSEDEIIKILLPNPRKTTLAQIGAARQMIRFARENIGSTEITESIDGKLAQPTINADITDILSRSDEQLVEIVQTFSASCQNNPPDGSGGSIGATEADGGEETAG